MDIFYILVIDLFIATAIFYVVFFSFVYYWHLVKKSYLIVPLVFTFDFLAKGFFIVCIIAIIIKYLPYFTNL